MVPCFQLPANIFFFFFFGGGGVVFLLGCSFDLEANLPSPVGWLCSVVMKV